MTQFFMAAHGLIHKKDQYLVTRRSALNDYMPFKWDIPGGFVESGETIENALIREVKEETGLIVKVLSPLYIYSNLSQLPNKQVFQAIYLCDFLDGTIILNPDEHDLFVWIDKAEISKLDTIAFLEDFLRNITF